MSWLFVPTTLVLLYGSKYLGFRKDHNRKMGANFLMDEWTYLEGYTSK